jgi:hypothetical protein
MLKKELLFLMNINQQLKENRVLPLATITSKEDVDGISQALLKANCSVLEITLRDDRVREIIHLFKNLSRFNNRSRNNKVFRGYRSCSFIWRSFWNYSWLIKNTLQIC